MDIQSSSVLMIKTIRVLKEVQVQKTKDIGTTIIFGTRVLPLPQALEDVILVSFPNFKKKVH